MRTVKTSGLLNSTVLSAGPVSLTEWVDYSWAEELTFIVDVQAVTLDGATAGSLSAKFQKRLPHRTGALQFATQRLVDLTTEEKAGWIAEGDWPAPLADHTLSAPVTVQRTVRNFGAGANLIITPAFTGGTFPTFQVTAFVIAKG